MEIDLVDKKQRMCRLRKCLDSWVNTDYLTILLFFLCSPNDDFYVPSLFPLWFITWNYHAQKKLPILWFCKYLSEVEKYSARLETSGINYSLHLIFTLRVFIIHYIYERCKYCRILPSICSDTYVTKPNGKTKRFP